MGAVAVGAMCRANEWTDDDQIRNGMDNEMCDQSNKLNVKYDACGMNR